MNNKVALYVFVSLMVGFLIGVGITKALTPPAQIPAIGLENMNMNGATSTMSMQDTMNSMSAGLQGKAGDAFDQEFLTEMIEHHQGAVAMAQMALQSAKHQEIKDLATNIITAQDKEIAEMQQWLKTWYGQ